MNYFFNKYQQIWPFGQSVLCLPQPWHFQSWTSECNNLNESRTRSLLDADVLQGSHLSCPAFEMITLTLLHLQELNPPRTVQHRAALWAAETMEQDRERERVACCKLQAVEGEQTRGSSPAPADPWWWLMQAGHTRPSRSAKLKAYFVKL